MSIEKITDTILADAQKAANQVLDSAKISGKEITETAEKQAQELIEQARKNGAEEKEKRISRRKAVADIDGRKITLQAKQELITQCFEKATQQIVSMKKEDYIEFLAAIIKNTGVQEGQLIFNQKEAKQIGPDLIRYLEKHLPGSNFSLAEETRNIQGGFMLKNGAVYINGTIEALVEEAKETLTGEVAQTLFQ